MKGAKVDAVKSGVKDNEELPAPPLPPPPAAQQEQEPNAMVHVAAEVNGTRLVVVRRNIEEVMERLKARWAWCSA